MTRRLQWWRAAALLIPACLSSACSSDAGPFLPGYASFDLLIAGGTVIDGRGGQPFEGDVLVHDGSIVFVGDVPDARLAGRVTRKIDASGKMVTPGFIDLHAHGDPLQTPAFENFLAMGVTTITLGQDGSSPPTASIRDWLQSVDDAGIGPNLAMFVGHGTLRELAGIGRESNPGDAAIADLLELLSTQLEYTFGLSTGLEYNPGLNANSDELQAMAQRVGQHDRLIMSHLRNEDDDQIEAAIAELLDQGRFARVHIAHLKSVYGKGSTRAAEILAVLDAARDDGVRVTADVYPYSASYTTIAIVFPEWAKTADDFAAARRDRRDELESYLRARIARRNGPEATLLGTEPYTGKTLAQLSHELEMPFEQVLIDEVGPGGASGAYFVMDAGLQATLLADEFVGVCSDGSPTGFHPRGHGTFARVVERHVMQEKLLTLPQAVQKMTSFAAGVLGLADRGAIDVGMAADLLVFDPARVRETATYPQPHQLAEGFDVVIVNGSIAREQGRLSDALHGRVLLPTSGVYVYDR
ncbi:MAG: amidohydrolase family protein [Gammaproteobacteria bacterium]|nr:amidohydrolase family protein [Gammaproteobacteria bacterium]